MKLSTEAIAGASARRPGRTLAIWLVILVVAGGLSATMLGEVLTTDAQFTNTPEAVAAQDMIEDELRGPEGRTEIFILQPESGTADDPEVQEAVAGFQKAAMELGPVQGAVSFYDTDDPSLVSEDGSILLVPVTFAEEESTLVEYEDELEGLVEEAEQLGLEAQTFGPISLNRDFTTISEEDLRKGEGFGIIVALIVLIFVFGALVAGLLPIAMAIGSITVALGITALVGQVWEFSFFVTNMISMMGLAVGIDYSLFVVSRFREERRRGRDKIDAIVASGATSNRAVFFSGMIVVLALIGLIIVPTTIFRSLAAGSIFVVITAVAASMTLLPALLSLLGDRINKGRIPFLNRTDSSGEPRHGFWNAITHGVMKRPVFSLLIGAGLLLAAAFSYLQINTGFAGVSTLPDEAPSKQAFQIMAAEFSGGLNSPVEVVVDGDVADPEVETAIEDFQAILAEDPLFGESTVEVNDQGELAVISAPVNGDPTSQAAVDSIERIRTDYVPEAFGETDVEVLVGGETAFNKDFFDLTDTYTPIVFIFVLGLSFILLMVVFRSIVVPIKAILLNLLSVGAAYGLVVLVLQKGVGAELFGFQQVEAIEAWLPLFLFSVLFGLSMDYHVFLLSRIKEHFDHTHDNTESVAFGVRTTAGLITGGSPDHGRGVRRLCSRRPRTFAADGLRPCRCGVHRRHDCQVRAGSGEHEALGRTATGTCLAGSSGYRRCTSKESSPPPPKCPLPATEPWTSPKRKKRRSEAGSAPCIIRGWSLLLSGRRCWRRSHFSRVAGGRRLDPVRSIRPAPPSCERTLSPVTPSNSTESFPTGRRERSRNRRPPSTCWGTFSVRATSFNWTRCRSAIWSSPRIS